MISRGDLSVSEFHGGTTEHAEEQFDLVVVVASWDSRCLEVTRLAVRAERVLLVNFMNKGSSGRSDNHRRRLRSWAEDVSKNISECEIDSLAFDSALGVWREVLSANAKLARRVMVDVSSFPKSHMLTLLGLLLRGNCSPRS